jgi:hypothetical protein
VVCNDGRVDISMERRAGIWSDPVLIGVGVAVPCINAYFACRGIEIISLLDAIQMIMRNSAEIRHRFQRSSDTHKPGSDTQKQQLPATVLFPFRHTYRDRTRNRTYYVKMPCRRMIIRRSFAVSGAFLNPRNLVIMGCIILPSYHE